MESIFTDIELWSAVLVFLTALGGLAVVITKMTPSVKDDEYASKFLKAAQWVAGLIGVKPNPPVS